jgi:hypothetical protein
VDLLAKVKELPGDMMEGVCSLIYAAPRISTDLNELTAISKILVAKFQSAMGKEFLPEVTSDSLHRWVG